MLGLGESFHMHCRQEELKHLRRREEVPPRSTPPDKKPPPLTPHLQTG